MRENKRGYKKNSIFANCGIIIAIMFLAGIMIQILLSGAFGEIGTLIIILSIFIPLGVIFGLFYYCSKSGGDYPEPKRDQTPINKIKHPQFTIYYGNKEKIAGHLEGNTVYGKKNKYKKGSFDDRDPQDVEFIWKGKVVERLKDNELYMVNSEEKIAEFDGLRVSASTWREINAYIDVDESKSTAKIIEVTENGEHTIGVIEGNVHKLNKVRVCAIYTFIYEFFS